MSTTFTASNGVVIDVGRQASDGKLYLIGRVDRGTEGGTHATASEEGIAALREFFDRAKPWHLAEPGEVWVLTTTNVGDEVAARVAILNGEPVFEYVKSITTKFPLTDPRIESARRIWPEVSR